MLKARKVDFYSIQDFFPFYFHSCSFKSFSVQKIEFSWNCNWSVLLLLLPEILRERIIKKKHFSNYANMTLLHLCFFFLYSFFIVKRSFIPRQQLKSFHSFISNFFSPLSILNLNTHNEPHYEKVIIFRDEILFRDISSWYFHSWLSKKKKNHNADVLSVIRTHSLFLTEQLWSH